MKKGLLLLLGLFVAGLAAWAVPREQTAEKVKIEFTQKYDAITTIAEVQAIDLVATASFEAPAEIVATDYLATRNTEVAENRYRWCGSSSYFSSNNFYKPSQDNAFPRNPVNPGNLVRYLSWRQ